MHKNPVCSDNRPCTAIVCAYNEEKTIAGVLDALMKSPLVEEIIAVDDGSTDKTATVLHRFAKHEDVKIICLPENQGKGYAMAEGIMHARGELLVFIDADLLNLTPDYILQIVQPLRDGEADMVIGCPSRGKDVMDMLNPFRSLSGERALYRDDILPLVSVIRNSRFGVETLINLHYSREGRRVRYVRLRGLVHPVKLEKTPLTAAVGSYTREASEIALAMARHRQLALAVLGLDYHRTFQ